MPFRLLQLSDPHLSPTRAYGVANFDAVVASVALAPPDLVVATGDLALDDPDDGGDRAFARARFAGMAAPWRAVPGNHDIGDTGPDPWLDQPVTVARRQAWIDAWGPDWWVADADDWLVVGLDSLLFASGLAAEAEQWSWLAGVVSDAGRRPMMVMLHKPLYMWDPDEAPRTQKTLTPEGRRLLRDAVGSADVRLVASGHVHQFRTWACDGQVMVWAPSTAFVSRAAEPSRYGGVKTVGAVEYRFAGRGVTWTLVRPPAMVDHDVAEIPGGGESLRFAPPGPAA